jgi:hypothetical protein
VLLPLKDAQEEAEGTAVDEPLLLPLKEGLPLSERVTETTALTDGDMDAQVVPVRWKLPLATPLGVDKTDAVALNELLPLEDAQEEADAIAVNEPLLLLLKEGQPLTERATVPVTLEDGEPAKECVALPQPLADEIKLSEAAAVEEPHIEGEKVPDELGAGDPVLDGSVEAVATFVSVDVSDGRPEELGHAAEVSETVPSPDSEAEGVAISVPVEEAVARCAVADCAAEGVS